MTLAKFIETNKLEMVVLPAEGNPNMPGMPRNFRCEISRYDHDDHALRWLCTPFSQGAAHTKAPTLADVLDCLASDASSVRNARDFEDWASDLGYDTDSRKAHATWLVCVRQTIELENLLGADAFNTLLSDVERL